MMAACITLPDPIDYPQAAMWPETVSTPCLVQFPGAQVHVETYAIRTDDGAAVPIAHMRIFQTDDRMSEIGLSLPMVQAWIAALRAAERDLIAAGAVTVAHG